MKNPLAWWNHLGESSNSNRVVAIFTFVIAFTGVLYTAASCGQLSAIKDQLKEMQSSNRPYVFSIPRFSFAQMPNPDTVADFPVTITLINTGLSPALHPMISDPLVGIETDADIIEHMRTCSVPYELGESAPLPPNQSLKEAGKEAAGMTTHTITKHLSEAERKDVIVNKTKHLFILGGVKYSGMRGGQFESIYCYLWNADSMKSNVFPWTQCSCNSLK